MSPLPAWRLQVFGPVLLRAASAHDAVQLGRKGQAAMAWLAARGESGGPRRTLVDLLWADNTEGDAQNALRQCLFQMRQAMGGTRPLLADRVSMRLDAGEVDVDLWRFHALAGSTRLEDRLLACRLYAGDFADDLQSVAPAFDQWAAAQREKVRRVAAALAQQCAQQVEQAADIETVTEFVRKLLAADPLHEGCWRALMELHARAGLGAQVEAVWHECQRTLRTHAGIEPSAATRSLHLRVGSEREPPAPHLSLGRHPPAPLHADDAAAAAHDDFLRGMQHYFSGSGQHNAQARAAWESAARLVPGRSDYAVLAAWTHFTDFNFVFNGAPAVNYLLAASKSRALLKRFPHDPWPLALHAKLLLWRGEFAGALDSFGQALTIEPLAPALWSNKADALLRAGRPREAMDHVRVAMDLEPADLGYFAYVGGTIHYALGDLDEAMAAFSSSARRNPAYCLAYRGMAAVHAELGHSDEARDAASHSKVIDGLPGALHSIGPYVEPGVPQRWATALLRAGLVSASRITRADAQI